MPGSGRAGTEKFEAGSRDIFKAGDAVLYPGVCLSATSRCHTSIVSKRFKASLIYRAQPRPETETCVQSNLTKGRIGTAHPSSRSLSVYG